jgi:hypothetical protein
MNFDWFDAWPALALGALLYGAACATSAREWWERRAARRRARVMLAPEADLSGCIQRASLRQSEIADRKCTASFPTAQWCDDPECFDDTPHWKHR